MGFVKYLRETWQSDEFKDLMKQRLISWRREPAILRVDGPTRLDRAHALGYKAKQGFFIVRARIDKGSSKREVPSGGRKPHNAGLKARPVTMNLQHIAEARVARKYPNCEVLNSYYVAEDGKYKWFEVIMVDAQHPAIRSDKDINWICNAHGRVFRGLTSAGKRSRKKD
jgi:large subunit ribosomal protein L15e